ncbi:Plectin [Bienertia sinuspersici]
MTTYKLEETPNLFIAPMIDNRFVYRMMLFNDESNFNFIRDIDLREDKLSIYGTEIKESMLQKLYDSLRLRPARTGRVYVNCNGACYISLLINKAIYRMIDNVIFDWSPFGVIVPNTINDVLRNKLHQKEQEVEELRKQLSNSQKDKEDIKMELQDVHHQLSVKEFELDTKKVEFQLSKEELKELQDQVSTSKKDNQNMEKELQLLHDQLSSTSHELKSTQTILQNKQHLLSSVEDELKSTKNELDSSIKKQRDAESQLSSCMNKNQELETELQKVQNELGNGNVELQLSKSELESSHKRILELEEQFASCEKERQVKEAELLKVKDQLSLIMDDQLQSMKIMLEFTEKEVEDKSSGKCFLDETPDIFISPYFYDKFIYRMVHFISESNTSFIRDIDIRKDKLVIYGIEINECIGSKLSDSLHLRQKTGKVFVNCDGACFIYVIDKGVYRPITNVIFDWSCFGVIVPNSVNDVLRKQLHQKDQELAATNSLLSSAKGEVEELGRQLSTIRKTEQDKEMELQKLNCQLSVKEFELDVIRNKFELSKEEVKELKGQLSGSKKKSEDVKAKHLNMQDRISSVQAELQTIKMNMKELECLLSSCTKQNRGIATELQKVHNELSSGNFELQVTKTQLETNSRKIIELEEELSACKLEGKAKEIELHSMKMNELQSIKVLLELTEKKVEDNSFAECYAIKGVEITDDVIVP